MKRCIFFDRDGIVNTRIVGEYVRSIDEFHFIDAFFDLYRFVTQNDWLRVVVTNQQGVGKGLMQLATLHEIHAHMQQELEQRYDKGFDAIYYCTELSSSNSKRRKPEPGMLLEAAERFNIDLATSWMIGDSITDVQAGRRAGTQTMLVGDFAACEDADVIVPDLEAAFKFFSERQVLADNGL